MSGDSELRRASQCCVCVYVIGEQLSKEGLVINVAAKMSVNFTFVNLRGGKVSKQTANNAGVLKRLAVVKEKKIFILLYRKLCDSRTK